ncbi:MULTISPECIES: hypothetical protein [unclassified Microcystis]|uniref:hypothetical protein n=1 Tax=unclassified Microcystis TaxID=2643300 RepID=UPI0022C3249C|nr:MULTISPECIES: hypothetical protein [unclassified Microcystis]MCA2694365.1 hypothetical protein [Microcystis sp. M034S2]MCA2752349.1 hypothetical protein [Microcystis sp. M144S2]MCZ8199515.1 hypothetical protein [Microcystis sp. LE19-55.1A]
MSQGKGEPRRETASLLPLSLLLHRCPVSETPELTRIVRQFLEANRAPWQGEKDF